MGENKKKGKKKKGNQTKHSASIFTAEDVNQTKPDDSMQNHHIGAPSNADSQSVGVSESDLDQEKRSICEEKCVELLEEINKLEVEKNICSQKEGFLEERIKLLQNEVDSFIQKEASLEEQIDDLQCKNASLTRREADFEERVKKMEEMHQSFALEEISIKEVVSKLDDANERLHLQVMELKDSRDKLAQENKQLTDSISTLESRIQHLEMVASFNVSSKVLEAELAILDEIDSGLDVDALQDVAKAVNGLLKPHNSILMITHYQRLLDYIKPNYVHIMEAGAIVRTGDFSLAKQLEKEGYRAISSA